MTFLSGGGKFYEELYWDDSMASPVDDYSEDPIAPILISEIEYAIQNLKNDKSPGLDNIYSEYLKAGGEPHECLVTSFQLYSSRGYHSSGVQGSSYCCTFQKE